MASNTASSVNQLLDAALRYAALGWRVHPLHHPIFEGEVLRCSCRKTDCDNQGKHPKLTGWTERATTDGPTIRQWWTNDPEANIGIACGPESGLFLLDKDGPGADARIRAYVEKNGITTAVEDLTTTTARTSKGEHLIFGWVDGVGLETIKNWVKTSEDLDLRTDGGQFVAPPSIHPSGRRYEWTHPPWETPPRPVPAWLVAFLLDEQARKEAEKKAAKEARRRERELSKITSAANRQKVARLKVEEGHPYARAALEDEVSELRAAPVGERNDTLNRAAFSLFGLCKGGALDRGEVERELSRAARSTGLKDDEISRTLRSAWDGSEAREIPERDFQCVRATAATSTDDGVGENSIRDNGKKGQSISTRIVDLALSSGASFWKTIEGEPFATIPNVAGHNENHSLKSKAVKTWLSGLLYHSDGRAPKGSAVSDALAILEGKATFEGATHSVFVRFAEHGSKFYLDLGSENWLAVEIGPDGWRVISSEEVPVKFRRAKGILELPEPTRGGNLEDLRRVLNIPEGSPWILARAWLVQAFKPTGPYPPLIVDGEQGSGKSWLGRILRYVIDPNKSPLRRPPRNEHEMMIAATNGWLVVYDNLSGLPKWLGDALCVVSTGGGMSTRELYTDSDEALFDIQRPVILNGIDALTTRGDLLGRAILLHLPRIEDGARRTEKEIKAELDRIRPGVIGAILDVISHGLRELPNVGLESMPRMADFAEWVTACEGALGWEPGAFLEAFEENQKESKIALIENDMFATSLVEFIGGSEEPFEDTAGFLLAALEERSGINTRNRPDGWPRTPRGARNSITRIIPALCDLGIEVSFKTGHGHVRLIRIEQHTATTKESTATIATKKGASWGDGGDSGDHPLIPTLEEKKREKEEKKGGGGVENRKLPPPQPPQPQGNGFYGGDGGGGGRLGGGEDSNAPASENTGRVFELSLAYYSDLASRNGGLTVSTLARDQGWPTEKAMMALEMLKASHGWVRTDASGYTPPMVEVA